MTSTTLATMADAGDIDDYGPLSYSDHVDEKMSGAVEGTVIRGFLIRALLLSIIACLAGLIVGVPLAVVGAIDLGGVFGLALFCAFVLGAGSFFMPYREGLSEWQLLLAGKAESAESSYAAVYGTLTRRGFPVNVKTRRFVAVGDPTVNNYLVVADGNVSAYVSVFSYGTSLYLGWSMWRKRMPITMMVKFVSDVIGGVFGRDNYFIGQIGSNRARAFREAVHASVREGMDAAIWNIELTIAGTFGSDVPIETIGAATPGALGSPAAPLPPLPAPPVPTTPANPPVDPMPTTPSSAAPHEHSDPDEDR